MCGRADNLSFSFELCSGVTEIFTRALVTTATVVVVLKVVELTAFLAFLTFCWVSVLLTSSR